MTSRVLSFVFVALISALPLVADPEPLVNPIPGLPASFIRGADVSTLLQVEQAGGRFFDVDGQPGDALTLLKAHGVNWIRLRLWNDPNGRNSLRATVALAQRAKALGLKFLLDFHYSDTWADPGHQTLPAAWAGLDQAGLTTAVAAFTRDTLVTLKREGALPDMVQLGNETNGGMLWPWGKTWKTTPDESIGGYDGFAALLNAAAREVRAVSPGIAIALHLADGGDHDLYRNVFDQLVQRGVDFDLIGFSYYAYWHGPLDGLADNLKVVSERYGKPVLVLETSYARGAEDADGYGNLFSPGMDKAGGYRASIQGQASALRDVAAAVAAVPQGRGLGVFYWEPAWLPVDGVGWIAGQGNNWENQTLFTVSGRALPSLDVFSRIGANVPVVAPVPVSALPVALTLALDQPEWTLPENIRTVYSDDSYRWSPVTWTPLDRAALTSPQTVTLQGILTGTKVAVAAKVTLVALSNLLSDPSFESGRLGAWTVDGPAGAIVVEQNAGNAHTGDWTLKYWKDKDFTFTATRVVEGLEDGEYAVRLWSMGGGNERSIRFSAQSPGLPAVETPVMHTGWQKWAPANLAKVRVQGGTLTLRLVVDARSGCWGNFDDVELVRQGPPLQ